MPRFAHVHAEVMCPQCGAQVSAARSVGFQWGYCSNPLCGDYFTYEVGDPLYWRLDKQGKVPPWAYFRDESANIGDPLFADLIVRESEFDIRACLACGRSFGGIAIVIKAGRLAEVRAIDPIEALTSMRHHDH
jgi:hypothetical protein